MEDDNGQNFGNKGIVAAVETEYANVRFRSRTEARWAVFFEKIGFKWIHEPQIYALKSGKYLPDFRITLPNEREYFCEVKPKPYAMGDRKYDLVRYHELVNQEGISLLLLIGAPHAGAFTTFLPNNDAYHLSFFQDYEPFVNEGGANPYWMRAMEFNEDNGEFYFVFPGVDDKERRLRKAFGRGYLDALRAAQGEVFA